MSVFHITRSIWQGRFASQQRLDELRRVGITHILNVGESPSQLTEADGPFRRIVAVPIEDLTIIPTDLAIQCVELLHQCVCDGDSHVYLHCVAGWNRSPTVLWLYLVACGMAPALAKNLIATRSFDSVPAHPRLISDSLVTAVCEYGAKRFLPHPRIRALDCVNSPQPDQEPPRMSSPTNM